MVLSTEGLKILGYCAVGSDELPALTVPRSVLPRVLPSLAELVSMSVSMNS